MVIITAGMIGVGKTTLTKLLADHLGTTPFYEPVEDNPVLPLFYSDQKQYAFLLQIYFLNRRFEMIKKALKDDNNILDRSIYEDALFTEQNHIDGNISDQEMDVYNNLLANMMGELQNLPKKNPDLLVYASADFETILKRIQKRGRDYEQIDTHPELIEYYRRMWNAYSQWFEEYNYSPKIKLDLDKYDLDDEKNHETVLSLIDAEVAKIRS
jgi:deoxyadenosine/deoxycytidine kinase